MVLVKAITTKSRRLLYEVPKQRKKSLNDLTGPDEEEHVSGDENNVTEVDVANAKQQLTALLSFKEALSTGKRNFISLSKLCNRFLQRFLTRL
jgi:hypothetical protein